MTSDNTVLFFKPLPLMHSKIEKRANLLYFPIFLNFQCSCSLSVDLNFSLTSFPFSLERFLCFSYGLGLLITKFLLLFKNDLVLPLVLKVIFATYTFLSSQTFFSAISKCYYIVFFTSTILMTNRIHL